MTGRIIAMSWFYNQPNQTELDRLVHLLDLAVQNSQMRIDERNHIGYNCTKYLQEINMRCIACNSELSELELTIVHDDGPEDMCARCRGIVDDTTPDLYYTANVSDDPSEDDNNEIY